MEPQTSAVNINTQCNVFADIIFLRGNEAQIKVEIKWWIDVNTHVEVVHLLVSKVSEQK